MRLLTLAVLCLAAAPVGETKTWDVTKREVLARGEDFSGLILTARGELKLGFAAEAVEVKDEPSFWAGAWDDGAVWAGTGKGAIYRIAGGKAEKHTETGEMLVTSIAKHDGALYAATIPNGKIFKRAGAKWEEWAKVESKYVWQIRSSAGGLLAACGAPGALYEVSGGAAKKLWPGGDLKCENVLSIAADGEGIVIGTAAPGWLVRAGGTGRILHDFGDGEVRAIASAGEGLVVAVNAGQKVPPSQFLQAVEQTGKKEEGPPAGPVSSAVWRIGARTERILELPSSYVCDVVARADGVYVATNASGRVYRLPPEGGAELAFDFPEGQALGFVDTGRALGCLMGNRAALRTFGGDRAAKGTYVSPVLDAKFPSAWGTLSKRGTGRFSVETRSGAIAKAGEGWSEWQAPSGDKVASPKARFLQFRITIEDPDTAARGVTIAYRNENQRPVIRDVKVEAVPPRQDGFQPGERGPSPRLGEGHSTVKRIQWQAADEDGDYLVFRVSYRPAEGGAWLPLLGKAYHVGLDWQWNTENVADGRYVLKVAASDEMANPEGEALSGEFETEPFLVDNTKPEISIGSIEGGRVAGHAADRASNIVRIEFQVDGGEWRSVAPKDRLFDDKKEEFDFGLGELKAGAHTLTIRALDQESNAGLVTKGFEVK